jgi:Trypsin-co-occurring domain 1
VAVPTEVVTYQVDESTVVSFEIEPPPGFRQATAGEIAGKVKDAVGPAVEAAKVVLDKVKRACPDQVDFKFGIKGSGGANWADCPGGNRRCRLWCLRVCGAHCGRPHWRRLG